jgi:hypothetical protein
VKKMNIPGTTGGHISNYQASLGVIHNGQQIIAGSNNRSTKLIYPSIKLAGRVEGKECVFLLDCGATGDFISEKFIKDNQLAEEVEGLEAGLVVQFADGQEYITKKIMRAVKISVRDDAHVFNNIKDLPILPLIGYDAILGMPWLREHNPDVDWCLGTIKPRLSCSAIIEPVCPEGISEIDKNKLNQSLIGVKEEIVNVIMRYKELFREELPLGLPMQRPIEHNIELKSEAEPVNMKPWRININDSEEIDRQVSEHLAAGRIRLSTSPYNAPNY